MINKKKIRKLSVLQHDSSDCGVACLASVINFFGGSANMDKLRILSGTSKSGTTMLGLYQAAEKNGLEVSGYEASVSDILDYKGIMILHVLLQSGSEHYIVNYGFQDNGFIIWDPGKGMVLMSKDELGKIWISKKCLGLKISNSFNYSYEKKKVKLNWLIQNLKKDKNLLITSIIIGIGISLLGLVMAIYTQKLIDKIIPAKDIKVLVVSLILVFILISARIILNSIRQLFLLSQGKSFNIRIVDSFFGSILLLPKSFFDTRKTGDFIARLNDTTRIQRVIAEFAGVYIIDLIIILVSLIVLFVYNKIIALFTICTLPVFFLVVYSWNRKIISGQLDLMAGYAQVESNFIDSLKGIFEIKSLSWQERIAKKNLSIYTYFQGKAYSLGKIKNNLALLTGVLGSGYLILILLYSSISVIRSEMTQGILMAVISISSTIVPSVLNLALTSIPINEAKVALSRMFEYTQIDKEEHCLEEGNNHFNFDRLDLKKISFRFPGRKLLLKNIDLSITRGQITSLVGESGGGKSTLVNLIMKFYNPESGVIVVDNKTNFNNFSLNFWRSIIAVIPQEIHIFNGTILENLISEQTGDNLKELISLITFHKLESFFDSFPSGLYTIVGEEGLNLSGGQKQIIAFTRALVQKPKFLLIDEGTSNLDCESEKIIMNILIRIKINIGILLVSHRINIVKGISDRIYVLDKGSIADSGTHEELISGNVLYKKYFTQYKFF